MTHNDVIGIDVSKQTLHISSLSSSHTTSIPNDLKSITTFLATVDTSSKIIYEPTGVYSSHLHLSCNLLNKNHYLIHSNDAHHLSKSLNCRNKNDDLDALSLARLGKLLDTQDEL